MIPSGAMSPRRVLTAAAFLGGLVLGFASATSRTLADPPPPGAGGAAPTGGTTAQPTPVACTSHNECRVVFRRVHQVSGTTSCGPCGCCPTYEPFFDPPPASGATNAPTTQGVEAFAEAEVPSLADEPSTLEGSDLDDAEALQSSSSMRSRSRRPQQPIVCPACPGPTPVRAACVQGSCQILP